MNIGKRAYGQLAVGALVATVLASVPLMALETATHVLVNRQAVLSVTSFDLESYLRDSLGLTNGSQTLLTPLTGGPLTVRAWIELGGELEDEGWPLWPKTLGPKAARYYNHFHDPLRPWDAAGLTFLGPNESSVRWMQQRDQGSTGAAGGNWSWHDARRMYYQALTEPDRARRDALLAATFRALGQVMHLVVDASNPDHARDDEHWLASVPVLGFWNYDTWVAASHGAPGSPVEGAFVGRFLSRPIGFDPAILAKPIQDTQGSTETATVPIARLIDADMYDGANPSVTFNAAAPSAPAAIGLAEVANANFFSAGTLRGEYPFPRPGTAGLIRTELLLPRRTPDGRDIVRRYWTRPAGQGLLPANPLRAECAGDLNPRGVRPRPYPCVDDVVWNAVAAHMLPRAVGYARGVLEYFFRGTVAIGKITWDNEGLVVRIQNTGGEEMDGAFELWARQNPDTPQERRARFVTLGDGEPVRLRPGERRTFRGIAVPPDAIPTPKYVLVFKGRLGLEAEAVVGQVFTVPHVEIRQTTYRAETVLVCSEPDAKSASPPLFSKGIFLLSSVSMGCGWRIVTHRVTGTLATNMNVDPLTRRPEPVIARIEARRAGVTGSIPLTLDGQPVAGVWERQGTEPDPTTFEIVDPTDSQGLSVISDLVLVVSYTNGGEVQTPMAAFWTASVSHAKEMYVDNRSSPAKLLVASRRSALGLLRVWLASGTVLEVLSHNGVPVPTNTVTSRTSGGFAMSEGIATSPVIYIEIAIDDFEVFSDGSDGGAATDFFESIELQAPHPDGPFYIWDAELRRVYQPMEREFLRAFVTATPVPFTITLTGQEAGAMETP